MKNLEQKLNQIVDKIVDGKKVFGSSWAIKQNEIYWKGSAGNLNPDSQYFIASTTKLFTSALIMNLWESGEINLEDSLSKYFDPQITKGLHVYKGFESSSKVTLKQLLSHTSGLPDYFQGQNKQGQSLEQELIRGDDQSWGLDQVLKRSREMEAKFLPGTKKKAYYSDVNYQLLGAIIEKVSSKSFEENCQMKVINKLGLNKTYLYKDPLDVKPASLFYKKNKLKIPKAMSSFGPDGGMVSNSEDMLRFIEAFCLGELFENSFLNQMQDWKRIFFPMQSGMGIHKFALPWFFDPFRRTPYFIGHSGLSGALAFYAPEKNLFITGTVNQIAHPELSFKTMLKLSSLF